MKPRQPKSTLVATRKKNPSEDPVVVYHRLLVDPSPESLTVIEDLLEETGLKLSELSEQDAKAMGRWRANESVETEGIFVLQKADPLSGMLAVEWKMWRDRNYEVSVYYYDNDYKYTPFSGKGDISDAVSMAWEAVRVCRRQHPDEGLDALLDDLESELHAAPTRRMNPAHKKNPALTKEGVLEQFDELMRAAPRQPEAISVAQDLLLEQGMTLTEVSEMALRDVDPKLAESIRANMGRSGVFFVGDDNPPAADTRDHIQWSIRRQDSRNLVSAMAGGWRVTWQAQFQGEIFDDRMDIESAHMAEEVASYATDYAWYMVKVLVKAYDDEPGDIWRAIVTRRWLNDELTGGHIPDALRYPSSIKLTHPTGTKRNPAPEDSDTWGEHGPDAYERAMMVKDEVEQSTLMDFEPVEVFAAISPRGKQYMAERGYPKGIVDDEYATFVILAGRERPKNPHGDDRQEVETVRNEFDTLVQNLNENWPVEGGWAFLPWHWGALGNEFMISVAAPGTRAAFYKSKAGSTVPHPFGRHDNVQGAKKWAKENPFVTDPKAAEERFWEVLADPDPASMDIALDILEEGGLIDDLAGVSERRADPEQRKMYVTPPTFSGVFEFGIIGHAPQFDHKPGWWAFPKERMRRLNDESYVIVEWMVTKTTDPMRNRWVYEIYFWRNSEGWGDLKDSELFADPNDARDHAVESAWRIVQILKASPKMKSNRVAAAVFRKPSQFQAPTENPATGKKPNPPEDHQRKVLDEFERLLREPDPGALIVAKDLLEQNGIPLSKASRWTGEPWSARFSENGGDAGVFVFNGKTGAGWTEAQSSRDYRGISWAVVHAEFDSRVVRYDVDVMLWWNGASAMLDEVFHSSSYSRQSRVRQRGGGSRRFQTLETARTYALQVAWAAVTWLKQNWEEAQNTSAIALARLLRRHNPVPLDPSVNPAQSNPIEAFKRLLTEPRPTVQDLSVAQDILEEAGLTLAEASEMTPEFLRREILVGKFRIGDPESDVTVSWHTVGTQYGHDMTVSITYDGLTWREQTFWEAQNGPPSDTDEQYVAYQRWRTLGGAKRLLNVSDTDEAVYHCVKWAWHCVKVIVRLWSEEDIVSADEVKKAIAESLHEQPKTPQWLIAPYGKVFKPNPPPGNSAPENLEPPGIRIFDYDDDGDVIDTTSWYPEEGIDAVSAATRFLEAMDAHFSHDLDQYSVHDSVFEGEGGRLYVLFGYTDEELVRIQRKIVPGLLDRDNQAFEDNPCECEMKDQPKQNPAWVTKHLADSWVTLEQKVPTKWLPKLDRTTAKGKRLVAEIPEYGCGAYGCVMPTNDPAIVLKLTTDDTEAQFAARLANKLPVPIVTKYELVMHLPTAKRQGRSVYLLWREAADEVGNVDKVVGEKAEIAIDKQHKAAQAAFDKLAQGEPAERELAAWQVALQGMAKIKELTWLANGMIAAFQKEGIFFGDIHGGNLGKARGQWVITDPGHVAVVESPASVGGTRAAPSSSLRTR